MNSECQDQLWQDLNVLHKKKIGQQTSLSYLKINMMITAKHT
jgi:hypothetical protein